MELISTPNPNAKKIELEHTLTVGTVINSSSDTDDKLCNWLLTISGITGIFVGPGFITITKEDQIDWDLINNDIITQFDKL
tara:strand:+ start:271 stop:513 length:243 start_codon:yes stop_codon:yes gene_type:complete